ncbi:head GIN domain-containing protein [Marivirga salinae]|uniref:Head GIN domain-containing protein n=1 Tax=Marivirga salinarum TaxID=3059078 RepID=A0AA51NBV0_9BACT|nr:head GIN domain-containing protein [Marivirga sp. BDSF4-3]WMN12546.1 head GIN domain-containing protein [Marivirga sp. BDSF4-3]
MKNILLVFVLALFACQVQSQEIETRSLSDFTSVSSSQSIRVTLKKGNEPKVDVSTTGELEDVITEVKNGNLKIEMESNKTFRNVEVEVTVYFQELESLKASSSSRMMSEDLIEANNMEIKGSSSARMDLNVKANNIEVSGSSSARIALSAQAVNIETQVSSSCRFNLDGNAENFEAQVSSSGRIDASEFSCDNADLAASSSGRIELNVQEKLIAKASSSGRITYGGKPSLVDVNSGSGGKISKM